MNFAWAEPYPDLYKVCTLFERYDLLSPTRLHYDPLKGHLQKGPTCGLVALAMLTGNPCDELIASIFGYAKKMGFTFNGEIFSVNYMHSLAKEFLPNRTVEQYTGSLADQRIKDFLLSGGHMLVPYDTDKDNSPRRHNGNKAHWCALSGAVEAEGNFFVLARHGKARNVAVWDLNDLATSNQQLFQYTLDDKSVEKCKFPEGGISGIQGLNCKSVLVSKANS